MKTTRECGTCKWSTASRAGGFYCNCVGSPSQGEEIELDDTCRDWEEGKNDRKRISFAAGNHKAPDRVH